MNIKHLLYFCSRFTLRISQKSIFTIVLLILSGIIGNEVRGLYKSIDNKDSFVISSNEDTFIQSIQESENIGFGFICKNDELKVGNNSLLKNEKLSSTSIDFHTDFDFYLPLTSGYYLLRNNQPILKAQQHFLSLQLVI